MALNRGKLGVVWDAPVPVGGCSTDEHPRHNPEGAWLEHSSFVRLVQPNLDLARNMTDRSLGRVAYRPDLGAVRLARGSVG